MVAPIRVLVVDDHSVVREGLCAVLELRPGIKVIGEAADGEEAVEWARRLQPDVILMDLKMPKKNGVSAIREIRAEQPDARILVLSSTADDVQVLESLRAGAAGYMLKSVLGDDLASAISSVHAGQSPLDPSVAHHLVRQVTIQDRVQPLKEILTERELEIVRLVAQGLSNHEIAARLDITVRTAGTHISHILAKAGLDNRTQLALCALRQGLASIYPE